MAKTAIIEVIDTSAKPDDLTALVLSLHNRNMNWHDLLDKGLNLWTVVEESDEAPMTFFIHQTNGEINYNQGRARVVESQIWCGQYKGHISKKLTEAGISYKSKQMIVETEKLFYKDAKPFALSP